MKIRIGVASERGERSEMQDSHFVADCGRQIGVFDGHGPEGEYAANFAAEFFQKTWADYSPVSRAAQFLECAKRLSGIDGGTTATIAEVVEASEGNELIVHNVGDSPAYFLAPQGDDEPWAETAMTEHHGVSNKSEVERMAKAGSPVSLFYPGTHFEVGHDHYLAMSRALGDSACRGVIALPYSKRITIPEGNSILVMASDGVLDKWTKDWVLDGVIELATSKLDLPQVPRTIVDQALPLTHDNATMVVSIYDN